MNDFTPKQMHLASLYLQEKVDKAVQKREEGSKTEEGKSSFLKQFVNSIFKR
ncbi:MAG: hypothetical protein ABFR02_08280 [Campylobacterota bacterium]